MRNDLRFCERAQNGGPCFSSKFKGGPLLDVRVKRFSPFRLAVRYVECAQVKRRRQSPGKLRNVTEFGPEDTRTQAGQWVKTVFAKPGSPAYLWEVVQCRSRGLYQRCVCSNFVIGRLDYRGRMGNSGGGHLRQAQVPPLRFWFMGQLLDLVDAGTDLRCAVIGISEREQKRQPIFRLLILGGSRFLS